MHAILCADQNVAHRWFQEFYFVSVHYEQVGSTSRPEEVHGQETEQYVLPPIVEDVASQRIIFDANDIIGTLIWCWHA